jgi:Calcineurin-like phosphoesterase
MTPSLDSSGRKPGTAYSDLAYCRVVEEEGPPTFVVGDVHGHLDELLAALAEADLVDEEATWCGGDTHLWFLGDFVDRGPDGIGVIDLVMRLSEEAEAAGGQVQALLGNHEILLLGMHRFGDTEVPSDFGPRSFARSWEMNGGQPTDQEAVTDEHIEWLTSRPAVELVGTHLLMHSDTLEYLVWGSDIEEINENIQDVLDSDDLVEWWEVWRRLTTRHAFRGPNGADVAAQLLTVLGGEQVVHGHSVIADQLGIAPAMVDSPYEYAGGKALGVDGGVFVGGPCLVVELPWKAP